ncbi:hypothetical protein [Arthrobacter psychrochitiniphilus]|uniref:hypothetical protein n=1 Tax=Arthrobacter psychrochitiniphilus TaxID=291045 RepID=UPI000D72E1A5|nr:hypothetical protein [Arthrobacter psychrochitiniphilus]NYG17170.1 hypothetical protein [Arthrobacter psychrochitiniphilus]
MGKHRLVLEIVGLAFGTIGDQNRITEQQLPALILRCKFASRGVYGSRPAHLVISGSHTSRRLGPGRHGNSRQPAEI